MASSSRRKAPSQPETRPESRPQYTNEQLQTYFSRIRLPQEYLESPVLSDPSLALGREHGLPLLCGLTRYHACNVPFENIELHYSEHKTISLDMGHLYDRFALDGPRYGRGGRCMENNGFFGTVLRSLGYDVRNCAARVSRMIHPDRQTREKQGSTYGGWNHMLNLVRLDGQWHVVDVGMGAMGPNMPYPLEDGYETESIAPRKIRLQKRSIPEHVPTSDGDAQKLWCYDVCFQPDAEGGVRWTPAYCFTETEYLPQDYEMMSWFTSTCPRSFFTQSVMCSKMLMDDAGEKLVGNITLFDDAVHKTIGGDRQLLQTCATDRERIEALESIFHVRLTDAQRKAALE
ncbi:N-hydroxyarylamine O-acetyltransferase [Metarhizium rileyi]|uniref:DUF1279 super n=1 Tax=Metarhizium rileyi (strain RCEF 4871) TaxID=1649241 RepID=A0A167GVF9_METRR|nr:N-hydroxyarylamine O-acetyltransferase [Metarhizium rileyi RCEF 4871]TWU71522.1 DUF1279 super [Metarhizium rileyi]